LESRKMSKAMKIALFLKRRLLHFTILAIIIAIVIGYSFPSLTKIPKTIYSYWIMTLAIFTILPSMIMMRGWELKKAAKMWREVLLGVVYAYLLGPFLAYLLAFALPEPTLRIGYFLSNIVPISAAALSYVMLAKGNIELGTVILVVLALLTLPLVPLYLGIYGSMVSVHVPVNKVLFVVAVTLFLPLIIGQSIRYLSVKKKCACYAEKEMAPYLSIIAMVSLLLLVFSLVLRKAPVIVKKPELAALVWGLQATIVFTLIGLTLIIDKLLGIKYEDHQALAFVSITKNQSIPAAIAVMSIGGLAVLPPALIPAIQPVLAITYLHMEDKVRKFLGSKEEKVKSPQIALTK